MRDHHTIQSGRFQPDHQIAPISAADLLKRLRAEFKVISEFRPLELGVHGPLHAALPGTSKTLVRKILAFHCGSRRYLEALAAGGARYALDGSPAGQVTEAHRVAAVLSRRAEKATPSRCAGPQRARGAAGAEVPPRATVSPRPILRLRRQA